MWRKGFRISPLIAGAISVIALMGASPVSAQQKITLSYWKPPAMPTNQAEDALYNPILRQFELKNPGVTVTHLVIPWANAEQKLTAAFAAGDPPDVSYLIEIWLHSFQSKLRPLPASMVKGDYPSFVDGAKGSNGKIYGVPYLASQFVLAVNKTVWEKAGKPPLPKTVSQMVSFAKKLTFDVNGKHPGQSGFNPNKIAIYGFGLTSSWDYEVNFLSNYLWDYGAHYINKAGTNVGFDNAAGRAALKVMKAMATSGAETPLNLYPPSGNGFDDAFYSGQIGMMWVQNPPTNIATAYPKFNEIVVPTPSGPAGRFITGDAGYLSVASASAHPQVAMKFINALAKPNNARKYLTASGLLPARPMKGLYNGKGLYDAFMRGSLAQSSYVRQLRGDLPYSPTSSIISYIDNYLDSSVSLNQMLSQVSSHVQLMAQNAGMK